MSWHREGDCIVVDKDCEDLVHSNIQFQMGTSRRPDGKLIVIDESILYLCGKEKKKRRFFGRRSSNEITVRKPFVDAIKIMRRGDKALAGFIALCPQNQNKCRFWNDVFGVCAIACNHRAKVKERTPCHMAKKKLAN